MASRFDRFFDQILSKGGAVSVCREGQENEFVGRAGFAAALGFLGSYRLFDCKPCTRSHRAETAGRKGFATVTSKMNGEDLLSALSSNKEIIMVCDQIHPETSWPMALAHGQSIP